MDELRELEAIKRLKYRYLRTLDAKEWDALADTLTEDATCAYGDGAFSFEGRDAILDFLRKALGGRNMVSSHRVHHPEIDFRSETQAVGLWALDDVVIETGSGTVIRGAATYRDEYVKQGGEWRIRSTGYERLYEETFLRKDVPSLRLTANRWS